MESFIHRKRKQNDDVRVRRFWNLGRQKTRKHNELPNVAKINTIIGNILFVSVIAVSIRLSVNEKFILVCGDELVLWLMLLRLRKINIWHIFFWQLSFPLFI